MQNTTRLLATVAALALLVPAAAKADDQGFYLAGNLGLSIPSNADYNDGTNTNTVDSDIGFAGIAAVGYQFDSNWRVQAEFAARLNQVGDITGIGAGPAIAGNIDAYSLMADAIYNIPTGTRFEPYLGAGAGVAWVKADGVSTILTTSINDTDTLFAYQGIAGVEYKINPQLRAGLDYRYFRTADPNFTTGAGTAKGEYENHTVTLGLRYLMQPAAAPMMAEAPQAVVSPAAPPAPPMVPNNYIVFFDFDRSTLTPEADRILAAAAQNAGQAKVTKVEVTGHADRSGSAKYNQRLSQRRGDVVKSALVSKGIAADEISVVAKGESDPLVPTADGVREAQNRRVQVVLK